MTPVRTLWEMPVAPTGITRGPTFAPLFRRQCEVAFYVESDSGDQKVAILFNGVEIYRCTYRAALTADLISAAYGRVVDLGQSDWLLEVGGQAHRYYSKVHQAPPSLKHLAICFDGGPAFEFICSDLSTP